MAEEEDFEKTASLNRNSSLEFVRWNSYSRSRDYSVFLPDVIQTGPDHQPRTWQF